MRIKIVFFNKNRVHVPFNANKVFSLFLSQIAQENDFPEGSFNFSPLRSMNREVKEDGVLLESPIVWYVTSPFADFVEKVQDRLSESGLIKICDQELLMERAVPLPAPDFTNNPIKFKCLSPITVSKVIRQGGGDGPKEIFFNPHESEFYNRIRLDLIEKYRHCFGTLPKNNRIFLEFDKDYEIKKKKISKLIEIDGEKIKSWLSPFIMAGSPELLSIAYDWGVGNRNPMGFGMVEVVRA